jgi:hypothetical protein
LLRGHIDTPAGHAHYGGAACEPEAACDERRLGADEARRAPTNGGSTTTDGFLLS